MKRLWLLLVSIVLCFVACDMPATGGNPGEGSLCKGVTKNHANKYYFELTLKCQYEEKCGLKLFFDAGYYRDSLSSRCFSDYELDFVTTETSKKVLSAKEYNVPLESDDHLRFSLIDINNVEKKYDIDLSGIINSYTVRGDSVDVNVMKGCSLWLFSCKKDQVYGNNLSDGKYTFLRTEGCDKEYSYDCSWRNQGFGGKDELDIHAMITWKK
jgi:hypothetical protein